MTSNIYYIHIDGDNFFVSCELTRFPEYKNRAVIVGQERGIAVALNACAKSQGIKRGDPIFVIKRDFPDAIILPSHFDLYQNLSNRMRDIFCRHVDTVEHYSIDECFATVELSSDDECEKLLTIIRNEVELELGLTISAGAAKTKALAKVGSKANKPNGQLVINELNRINILRVTPVEKVWGIGRSAFETLSSLGVTTAYNFSRLDEIIVRTRFSAPIVDLWFELNAISKMRLINRDYKQSMQSTRMIPAEQRGNRDYIWSEVSYHIEVLCRRLLRDNLTTRQLLWYVSSSTGLSVSASVIVPYPTQNPHDFLTIAEKQFYNLVSRNTQYRSAGVSVISSPIELISNDLFDYNSQLLAAKPLLSAIEAIRLRFGDHVVSYGSSASATSSRYQALAIRNTVSHYVAGLPLPYIGEVI